MLTEKEIKQLREELATAKNPLIFYDDDPDGVCSFILMYKIHREGKGIIVKSAPKLDIRSFRKVEEHNPDKVFILDVPMVDQELVDKMKRPTFWIDHHGPFDVKGLKYYNPRLKDPTAYIPTTRMCYQISDDEKDLWIATVGCLSDWYLPDFIGRFAELYPDLLPDKNTTLEEAVYKHPVGKLVKIFSFVLKGPTSEVHKSVKILTRIKTPEEILNQETAQGKFIYRRYEAINEKYEELIKEARKGVTRSKLLLFYYSENKMSFTADLANELVNHLYPKKVVLIARNKSGEMKCSLRSKTPIRDALARALEGVQGYGGGHENACGAVIKEEDWEQFLKNLKREIK
jgi:single-stranded DNA-specific DHH superfamily exonuclease